MEITNSLHFLRFQTIYFTMKKKFICFAIFILTAYILLYPADAVNASRNGLMLWYEKVLPTLLPFAILSNVLIHSGYMDAITKHLPDKAGYMQLK